MTGSKCLLRIYPTDMLAQNVCTRLFITAFFMSKNFQLSLNEGVTVIEIMVVPHSGIFGSFLKMSGVVPYIVI